MLLVRTSLAKNHSVINEGFVVHGTLYEREHEMDIEKCYLTKNDCYQTGQKITPKGIMVHSTGANNTELRRYVQPDDGILGKNNNGNDWNQSGLDVCVHAFIGTDKNGRVRCYQTLPFDYRGWHAGGDANNTHISFEICEDDLTNQNYFDSVYDTALELCTYLCKIYKIEPKNVICHSEGYNSGIASNHADVMHWFPKHGKSMDTFRSDLQKKLSQEDDNMTETEVKKIAQELINRNIEENYRTIQDVPTWGKATIEKLLQKGVLAGDGAGLNISYTMLRILVILNALGKLD